MHARILFLILDSLILILLLLAIWPFARETFVSYYLSIAIANAIEDIELCVYINMYVCVYVFVYMLYLASSLRNFQQGPPRKPHHCQNRKEKVKKKNKKKCPEVHWNGL